MEDQTKTRRQLDEPELSAEPDDASSAPARKGGTAIFALILLALIGGGALYHYWGFWKAPQTRTGFPPPPVTIAKPLVRDIIQWRNYTGQFQAKESVDVRARVSGYLESIDFTDGQFVKKGDLLFVIEPRPFELALEQAKADLAQAKANLHLAKTELHRATQLRRNDYATQETVDERQARVETAAATVQSSQAALDQAKLNLSYTHVVAPMSGRIGRHQVSVGNLVIGGTSSTSATTLLTNIVSLDPIHFVFHISEADGIAYQRLVHGGKLPSARDGEVKVDGQLMDGNKWTLHGTIDFVDNRYDPSTGTILMRAIFPNKGDFITPGEFGRVRLPMSKRQPTVLIPASAVVTDQDTKLVYVLGKGNKLIGKKVKLGPVVGDDLRVVQSGISPNDEIVIDGLMRVRAGSVVSPTKGHIGPSKDAQLTTVDPVTTTK